MTATWRSRDELVHQIVALAADRVPKRAIARAVGVSRSTLKAVLAAHAAQRGAEHSALAKPTPKAPRPRKTDVIRNRIAELFVRYPDITAQRVFEILRAEGFDGGYTAVKKHVRTLRAPRKPAPSLTAPAYGPGEMAESDWSPYTVGFIEARRGDDHVPVEACPPPGLARHAVDRLVEELEPTSRQERLVDG
jgi:transposase